MQLNIFPKTFASFIIPIETNRGRVSARQNFIEFFIFEETHA